MILSVIQDLYNVTEHLLSLSGPAARTIAENRRILRPHVQMFSERRDALITKYADESGAVKQGSENWDKFIKDFTDLLNWDVDVALKKLPADTGIDAFSCDTATVRDLDLAMEFFVEAPEDVQKETATDATSDNAPVQDVSA